MGRISCFRKSIVLFFLGTFIFSSAYSQDNLCYAKRLELTQCSTDAKKIDESILKLSELLKTENDFAKKNALVWESYNLMCELDKYKDLKKDFILARYKNVVEYLDKNYSSIDSNTLLSCTDIISCSMTYLSKGELMKQGLNVKKYYSQCLKLDKENLVAMVNLAQWYYYAPAIGGGSKKKCYEQCKRAYEILCTSNRAYTDYERMYVSTVYSQCLFEQKKLDESSNVLEEAKEYGKEIFRVQKCILLNKESKSWFFHCSNRTPADIEY